MKLKYLFIAFAALAFTACSEDSLDSESIFPEKPVVEQNDFDRWLEKNYAEPYNIQVKYRFEYKESDPKYNVSPASLDKSIALAKITKFLWLESYEELLGKDFIRTYCPRILFFVGSPEYNESGSIVLGTAEGGKKITLFNVNELDYKNVDIEFLNYWYFKTMHHEFAHILHQTKPYPTDYNEVTASDYQSTSWVNVSDQEALDMGFITPYASSETQEDFVEMIANYVTHDEAWWTSTTGKASEAGQEALAVKLEIVRDWLKTSWNIDLDKLRDIVQRRSAEVAKLDLQSLD